MTAAEYIENHKRKDIISDNIIGCEYVFLELDKKGLLSDDDEFDWQEHVLWFKGEDFFYDDFKSFEEMLEKMIDFSNQ